MYRVKNWENIRRFENQFKKRALLFSLVFLFLSRIINVAGQIISLGQIISHSSNLRVILR